VVDARRSSGLTGGALHTLPLAVALIMAGTHGYGLFLFGAIAPALQAEYGLDFAFVGNASATLQVAYMCGALILGVAGRRLQARTWLIGSTVGCAALMLLLRFNQRPALMLAAFAGLGALSAISWSSAVGVINAHVGSARRGLILTVGASGGSWGMLSIGVATEYAQHLLAPQDLWTLGAFASLAGLALLAPLLRRRDDSGTQASLAAHSAARHRWTPMHVRVAALAIVLSGLLGATAIPFTTYLSSYLIGEVGREPDVASSVWQVLGITGAFSGLVIGAIADHLDARKVIVAMFLAFAAACGFLGWAPSASTIALAGIGYGVALNPFWGLVATYLGHFFPADATMRIAALGLGAFGLCSALANWSIGQWATTGGSLATMYLALGATTLIMATLALSAPTPFRSRSTE